MAAAFFHFVLLLMLIPLTKGLKSPPFSFHVAVRSGFRQIIQKQSLTFVIRLFAKVQSITPLIVYNKSVPKALKRYLQNQRSVV